MTAFVCLTAATPMNVAAEHKRFNNLFMSYWPDPSMWWCFWGWRWRWRRRSGLKRHELISFVCRWSKFSAVIRCSDAFHSFSAMSTMHSIRLSICMRSRMHSIPEQIDSKHIRWVCRYSINGAQACNHHQIIERIIETQICHCLSLLSESQWKFV